jgi:hypothetical protein
MESYVQFLNAKHGSPDFDIDLIEKFWIGKVRSFFDSMPFTLSLDPAFGVRGSVRALIAMVEDRQREIPGATLVGTVIQHLVGAKLETILGLPVGELSIHGASTSDQHGRSGDLEMGDTVIHVTTAPGSPLVEKCVQNLSEGKRPVIVTARSRLSTADSLIEDQGMGSRIDVIDYEGFLIGNIFELGRFQSEGRRDAFVKIIDRYNEIIDKVETDPSLRIDLKI